ncbi:3'5'-cyclic nucleotide phosphodiesterase, conserved site [Phytophthora cactorum]|nr:3'5'-cyclic nucleotide phosphodiesterase, conserved site [Phytophthora cactorum]
MTVVMPLTLVQPIVPPLQPNLSKRNVAAPRRSVPRAVVLVQQPTHPILCYFEDLDVEQKFQTYFRREWQTCIVGNMVVVLLVFAAITEAYAASIFAELEIVDSSKELLSTTSFSHALWLDDGSFAAIATILYVLAAICIFHIWRRRGEYRFPSVRLDPVQLVLVLFYHCTIAPLFLVVFAGIEKQTRLAKQLSVVHIDDVRLTSVLLGEGFLDSLLFLELLGACVCTCLLRLQFTYCIIVVAELSLIAIVTTGIHGTTSVVFNRRLVILAIFIILLGFLLRIVREQERSTRREFLTSFHLVTEARRLSSANLEMKEELSGKLNYELHYEMGDILRILCQIKVKMSAAEKLDIDKIITALVRNHDLFEVTLSSAMPEFEEEVQGWLHMMDFKDHPAQSGDDPGSQTKPGSDVIRPREGDLSSWLMDRLQNHFFVDIFYLEQHCLAPLQAVFLACVKTNGLIERLDLDEKKLVCFAAAVEERYQNRNPYHNRVHAAAVVADINFYLRRVHLSVDDSTLLFGLVAAAAHDISHPGVSNGFLIATKSNLAITYSDDSVLERMHIAELYRILSHDAFDVFSTMGAAERAECRKIIIGMILATDLARHFQRISVLKTKTFAMSEQAQGLELSLLMETMLMLADLGHTAKPFAYHETWAERISEEFFRQGETEECNNLPISPLCDRKQANLPRSQVTFLTLVATPLFETAGQVFSIDEYDTVISELRNNIAMWKGRIEHAEGTVLETLSADSHKSKTLKENAS